MNSGGLSFKRFISRYRFVKKKINKKESSSNRHEIHGTVIRASCENTLYISDDPLEAATILFHAKRNVGWSLWKCRFDRLTLSLPHFLSPIYFNSRTPRAFYAIFQNSTFFIAIFM